MRILILCRAPVSGTVGTNAAFPLIFEKLVGKGHKVHFISYKEPNKKMEPKNVYYEYLPWEMKRGNELDKLIKTVFWVFFVPLIVAYKHYFKNKFDIIYCDDNTPIYWYLIKKLTKTSVVLKFGDIWSLFMQEKKSFFTKNIFKILYYLERKVIWKSVDRIQPLTKPLKEYFIKLGIKEDKLDLTPECIDYNYLQKIKVNKKDTREKLNINEKDPLIIFHGFFDDFKRVEQLIYSAPYVLKECPNAKFIIVGSGPPLPKLKQIAKNLKVEKEVIFTGWVNFKELIDYLFTSDIAVSLRGKNYGNNFVVTTSALQDLAAGKPLLAPNMAAQRTLFRNGGAILFEPENPLDLAKKIIYLIENPQIRKKLEKEGKLIAKEHDKEFTAQKTVDSILKAK